MRRFIWIFLAGVLLLLCADQVLAQSGDPSQITDDQVNAVARRLYCPVCENIPLDVCPTQACIEWRELIRLKLADGWDQAQILDYFALQYGDRVLAAPPPTRPINYAFYIILGGVILAAIAFLIYGLSRIKKPLPAAESAPNSNLSQDVYTQQLEEQLRNRTNNPS
jgi:cytochrome c-type biogenesis protein CcmH